MTFKIKDVSTIQSPHTPINNKYNNRLFLVDKNKEVNQFYKTKITQPITNESKKMPPRNKRAVITGIKPAEIENSVLAIDRFKSTKLNLVKPTADWNYKTEFDWYCLAERVQQLEQEKANALKQLQEAQSIYHSLVRQISAVTYIASIENLGKLLYISPQIDDLGFSTKDWLEDEQGLFKNIHKDDLANVMDAFGGIKDRHLLQCEYRIIDKYGKIHWLMNNAGVIRDENNKIVFLQGTLTDITKNKETEQELDYYRHRLDYLVSQRTEQLEIQNALLKSANANLGGELSKVYLDNSALKTGMAHCQLLLDTLGEGIIGMDTEGKCNYANPAALAMLGYDQNDLDGLKLNTVLFTDDNDATLLYPAMHGELCGAAVNDELPPQTIGFFRHKKNGTISVEYAIYPIWQEANTKGAVLLFREISTSLRHLATHDSLTGVKNRREFIRQAARLLASARKDHSQHVLCYLDFDHFKRINDTYGHAAGDELLRALMTLITSKLRAPDCIGRMGGDEFAILISHSSISQALTITKAIANSVNEFCFNWEGKFVSVSVSIGIASLTSADVSISEVINAADQACLQSKEKGRNQVSIFQLAITNDLPATGLPLFI